jgi:hypothetical protein
MKRGSDGQTRMQVYGKHIPPDMQPIVIPLLQFMGTKIADYHSYGFAISRDSDWAQSDRFRGILKFPERHTVRVADFTLGIIAVIMWRRYTGFAALQTSAKGASVHLYMSDKVIHDDDSFGFGCDNAFESYQAFRDRMKECVDNFFLAVTNPMSAEIRDLMHAHRNASHVRYGM